MTHATDFNWSEYITERLTESFELPVEASAIFFPTEPFENELKSTLNLKNLKLSAGPVSTSSQEEMKTLMQSPCHAHSLYLPAAGVSVTWMASAEAMRQIFSWLLRKKISDDEILSLDLLSGVQHVLAAEAIRSLSKIGYPPAEGALIQESAPVEEAGALYPIFLESGEERAQIELFIPYSLLSKLKSIEKRSPSLEQLKSWNLSLALEIGAVNLSLSELKNLKLGDCIFLDRCTIDPTTNHGTVAFCLGEKKLLRGKIKERSLKLLDYPFDTIGDQSNMDDFEATPDEMPKENAPEMNETPWIDSEAAVPPSPEAAAEEPQDPSLEVESPTNMITPDQIPLTMKVELGQVELSAGRLTEMAPGQLLDLGLRPEQGVYCTVGGKKVASGQLVKIGEMIGVRITELKG